MVKNNNYEQGEYMKEYNIYIINDDLKESSLYKKLIRRELHKIDIAPNTIIRSTSSFIRSSRTISQNDIFIVSERLLVEWDVAEHLDKIGQIGTVIITISKNVSEVRVNKLIDLGLTNFIIETEFDVSILREYMESKATGEDAIYYLFKSQLKEKTTVDIPIEDISRIETYVKSSAIKTEKLRTEDYQNKIHSKVPYEHITEKKIKTNLKFPWIKSDLLELKVGGKVKTISTAGKRHINIWGNYQLGCELGYIMAKHLSLKVLIIDSNRISPSLDMYFAVDKFTRGFEINDDKEVNTGLNIAIDGIRKKVLTKELLYSIAKPHKKIKNLYFLTGSYNLNNYEYFGLGSYTELLSLSKDYYDIVITLSNESIYDLYTSVSLIRSDINLIPIETQTDRIRDINSQLIFLEEKQGISQDKNYIVPYEYMTSCDLNLDMVGDISVCKTLPQIGFSKERRSMRSSRKVFVENMRKKEEQQYIKIIKKLGYTV